MASPDVLCHSPERPGKTLLWRDGGMRGIGFHPSQNLSPVKSREQVPLPMMGARCLLGVIFTTAASPQLGGEDLVTAEQHPATADER